MLGGVSGAQTLAAAQFYRSDAVRSTESTESTAPATAAGNSTADSTTVNLSPAGKALAAADPTKDAAATTTTTPGKLTPEEQQQVDQLKARDRVVRAHEQAHLSAAGGLATGGASYTYQRGPDGVSYAIGGEVPIALREGRTPQETIANAQTIRAAALAPADPSPQDRAVAAEAGQLEARARAAAAAAALAATEPAETAEATTSAAAGGNVDPPTDDAVARTRAGLAGIYGQIAAQGPGFTASA